MAEAKPVANEDDARAGTVPPPPLVQKMFRKEGNQQKFNTSKLPHYTYNNVHCSYCINRTPANILVSHVQPLFSKFNMVAIMQHI